jgi:hypothetical protein
MDLINRGIRAVDEVQARVERFIINRGKAAQVRMCGSCHSAFCMVIFTI